MTTPRFLSTLILALTLSSCGSDEPQKAAPPATPAARSNQARIATRRRDPAREARRRPRRSVRRDVTSGPTGTLTCSGPGKGTAFDKAAFRLDRVCVNDPRVSTYTAGGKTVTMTLKPEGQRLCATFGGVAEVPESCSCVAPAGGDCNRRPDGFVCSRSVTPPPRAGDRHGRQQQRPWLFESDVMLSPMN
jgi:hypothetical protein